MAGPNGKTLTLTLDSASRRQVLTDPDGGLTTYSFDAGGQLTSVVNPFGERTTWVYDAAGQVRTLTYGNAARTTYGYDGAGQLVRLRHSKADDTELAKFEYALNALGIPTSLVEASGDRVTWTYDAALRLTRGDFAGKAGTGTHF